MSLGSLERLEYDFCIICLGHGCRLCAYIYISVNAFVGVSFMCASARAVTVLDGLSRR